MNVPAGSEWKVVSTRLGLRLYEDLVEFRIDPRGREYFWLGGGGVRHEPLSGSDTEAHDRRHGECYAVAPRLDLRRRGGPRRTGGCRRQCQRCRDDSNLAKKSIWTGHGQGKEFDRQISRKRAPARTAPTPRGVSARPVAASEAGDRPRDQRRHAWPTCGRSFATCPISPKPGILFKDITPLLADPKGFHIVIDSLAERFIGEHIDAIVGIESRGFIFGSALAARLNASFVPVRKTGKLPAAVDRVSYDLEYGTAELEMHKHSLHEGAKVLVVDDLLGHRGDRGRHGAAGAPARGLRCVVCLRARARFSGRARAAHAGAGGVAAALRHDGRIRRGHRARGRAPCEQLDAASLV